MTKKAKRKVNIILHHLRQAQNVFNGLSLADMPVEFDAALLAHRANNATIAGLAQLVPKKPKKPALHLDL